MRVDIEIANPVRREVSARVQGALVDTGATRSTIPRSLADQLGLEIVGKQQIRTADGVREIEQSFALIKYDGLQTFGDVWISDSYPSVLIGVITLESLGLTVDPGSGRLTPSEFLLL